MKSRLPKKFGDLLRRLRAEAGLSQEDVAHQAGVHTTYVSLLERGMRAPTIVVLEGLAKALGTTMTAIISELEHGPVEATPRAATKKRKT